MSFLKKIFEQMNAVSELEDKEERDVVLDAVEMIVYIGKVDYYTSFYKEVYKSLDSELRLDIEKKGIKNIQTETDIKKYNFEINKLKMNLNIAKEKIAEITGDTYKLIYSYEENEGIKSINNMVVCLV